MKIHRVQWFTSGRGLVGIAIFGFFHFRALERFGRQDEDDCVATHRAIVRAAAEIGKQQEKNNGN
jgi:hypothetical protein